MKPALLLSVVLLLAACATPPPAQPDGWMQLLRQHQVHPGTYIRISHGRVLSYEDLRHLVQRRVPAEPLVAYLRSTGAPYVFTARQNNDLATAGASPELLTFLRAQQID